MLIGPLYARPRPSFFSHVVNGFDRRVSPIGCGWRDRSSLQLKALEIHTSRRETAESVSPLLRDPVASLLFDSARCAKLIDFVRCYLSAKVHTKSSICIFHASTRRASKFKYEHGDDAQPY